MLSNPLQLFPELIRVMSASAAKQTKQAEKTCSTFHFNQTAGGIFWTGHKRKE